MKVLTFGVNIRGFISTLVYVSRCQFSFTIAKSQSLCEVHAKKIQCIVKAINGGLRAQGKKSLLDSPQFLVNSLVASNHGRPVEGLGHKLYMDNYLSSPALFDDLYARKINCCGTVRHNRKNMPQNFGPQILKKKKGDIISRVRGNLRAVFWKDKRQVSGHITFLLFISAHIPAK
jgi:hypothetical protein